MGYHHSRWTTASGSCGCTDSAFEFWLPQSRNYVRPSLAEFVFPEARHLLLKVGGEYSLEHWLSFLKLHPSITHLLFDDVGYQCEDILHMLASRTPSTDSDSSHSFILPNLQKLLFDFGPVGVRNAPISNLLVDALVEVLTSRYEEGVPIAEVVFPQRYTISYSWIEKLEQRITFGRTTFTAV